MKRIKNDLIFAFIVGLLSAVGQVILIRELLIELLGNEIVFSLFLAIWLFLIAIATYIAHFFIGKISADKVVKLAIKIYLIILPFQFLFIRWLSPQLVEVSGLVVNLPAMISIAVIVLLPGCFIVGFLFPYNCIFNKSKSKPIQKVYIAESLGMVAGGIFFLGLVNFINSFSILVSISLISSILIFFYERKYINLSFVIIFSILLIFSANIFQKNYKLHFIDQKILQTNESAYGRFDVTESNQQENYYWDGKVFANSQNQKIAEEIINFVLLQHAQPERILLVGGLLAGYPSEIFKYNSIKEVDYLEIDKNIIEFFQKNNREKFPKLNLINADPVKYIQETTKRYDIILIDVPAPNSMFLNRFYTYEFFQSLKQNLSKKQSLVAITLPNAANLMRKELAHLSSVVWFTFDKNFQNTIFLPATKSIFIGSRGNLITNDEKELIARLNNRKINANYFNESLIFDVCNQLRKEAFWGRINSFEPEVNYNLFPKAYILSIISWAKHLDLELTSGFTTLKKVRIFLLICIPILLLGIAFLNNLFDNKFAFIDSFGVLSISFIAFIIQLILIYYVQIYYGYVYIMIAAFNITFMVGLTLGFGYFSNLILELKNLYLFFIFIALYIIIFLPIKVPVIIVLIFNIIVAVLEGTILAKIINKYKTVNYSDLFYFLDTIAATVGGLIFSLLLLPVFHLKVVLYLLIGLLIFNFILNIKSKVL